MSDRNPPRLRTAGVIASEIGEPLHRVLYVLRTRPITPAARAGVLRLYDRKAVGLVAEALADIDAQMGHARGERGER